MFTTMRRSWLLLALFALVACTSALNLESLNMDGIESYIHQGKKRQAAGTGSSTPPPPTPTSSPPPADTSTPPPSDNEPSSTPSSTPPPDPPSSSVPPPEESSTPPPASSPSSTPPPDDEPTSSAGQSSSPITTPIVRSTPLVSTEVQQYTVTYTSIIDGRPQQVTGLATRTSLHTTGIAVSTELPSPQQGGTSGDGLSTEKKNIIGGVVGGVGGALLLGGLAIVAWRIWGRKKHVSEDDDDMTFSTGSALGDKSSPPATANTPFQNNLEQYHNPGGRPNAAANF